jgi:hypothetical protein
VRRHEAAQARRHDRLGDAAVRVLDEEVVQARELVARQAEAHMARGGPVRAVPCDGDGALSGDRLEHVAVRHVEHERVLDVERALDEAGRALVDALHAPRTREPALEPRTLAIDLEALARELLHAALDAVPDPQLDLVPPQLELAHRNGRELLERVPLARRELRTRAVVEHTQRADIVPVGRPNRCDRAEADVRLAGHERRACEAPVRLCVKNDERLVPALEDRVRGE